MDLNGRVAIVTGAGRGLGRAYAEALAATGAAVVVNDADGRAAAEVAEKVTAAGGAAVAVAGSVGSAEIAQLLVERAVSAYGRLDILVTNAGVLRDRMLWKMSDEEFDEVLAVHIRGTFTCVRAAVRQMREQGDGGRIIAIGSPAGQLGNVGQTNYSGAKAAIVGMVRTWSMECARAGITVNAVIPVAATAMTATIPAFAPYVTAWQHDGVPLPRSLRTAEGFGIPEDVVGLVVFLASAQSAGVTGQAIGIGGDKLSLWSHPQEVTTAYRDGGWGADDIAEIWPSIVKGTQTSGSTPPEAPRP